MPMPEEEGLTVEHPPNLRQIIPLVGPFPTSGKPIQLFPVKALLSHPQFLPFFHSSAWYLPAWLLCGVPWPSPWHAFSLASLCSTLSIKMSKNNSAFQRFASFLASFSVLNTFIKLFHFVPLFHDVHGILGARSVFSFCTWNTFSS